MLQASGEVASWLNFARTAGGFIISYFQVNPHLSAFKNTSLYQNANGCMPPGYLGKYERHGAVYGSAGGNLCRWTWAYYSAADFRKEIKDLEWTVSFQDKLERSHSRAYFAPSHSPDSEFEYSLYP
jgi:hypothetical protein